MIIKSNNLFPPEVATGGLVNILPFTKTKKPSAWIATTKKEETISPWITSKNL